MRADEAWEHERFLLAAATEQLRAKHGLSRGKHPPEIELALEVLRQVLPELYGKSRRRS